MLNDRKFYFETIRHAIIAFGSLFNNIHIDRKDSSGDTIQTLKIPLTYGPKSKALSRVRAQPDLENRPFQLSMPIMSFQIEGFMYDSSRKLPPLNQSRGPQTNPSLVRTQYAPAPYDMRVHLSILSKNQEDALKIVEQILPYFNPAYVITLNDIPELNIKRDVPISLDQIDYADNFEGPVEDTRTIIWTLSFVMKLNFYGPVSSTGVTKTVHVNTHISDGVSINSGENYTVSVNPVTANVGDSWTFLEEFDTRY